MFWSSKGLERARGWSEQGTGASGRNTQWWPVLFDGVCNLLLCPLSQLSARWCDWLLQWRM